MNTIEAPWRDRVGGRAVMGNLFVELPVERF